MSKKLLIVISIVFVLLLGMMGTGFFFMWTKLNAVNAQPPNPDSPEAGQPAKAVDIGPIQPLETFIVNLSDDGGNRYLRVTMELELKDDEAMNLVLERLPLIRNGILMVLPSKSYADISSVDGKTALRDELIDKLNGFLLAGSVTNIYFTEFVVQ